MPCLRDLQSAFLQAIYTDEPLCADVLDKASQDANRFDIYRNNTRLGLTSILANSYPVLEQLVGEAFFANLARAYIKQYPQKAGDRHTFGAHLADFLRTFKPALSLPYLSDVARLEWATFYASLAPDALRLDFDTLSAHLVQEPELTLVLHPSASWVSQQFNGLEIWQAHQVQEVTPITLKEAPHTILVMRDEHDEVLFKTVSQDFTWFASLCQSKQPFAQIMALLHDRVNNMENFQREFAQVVQIGVFIDIKGREDDSMCH